VIRIFVEAIFDMFPSRANSTIMHDLKAMNLGVAFPLIQLQSAALEHELGLMVAISQIMMREIFWPKVLSHKCFYCIFTG